ncbi:methylated-DNA--[protein]-cysteine S-methyltransferase [Candidatus Margulisiibacteriota bacterium]
MKKPPSPSGRGGLGGEGGVAQDTSFQQKVWNEIKKIPYGTTISYKELATRIGKQKAYRAVAQACKANKHPKIIPCHRVIRSDGSIGGYNKGIKKKKNLLIHEQSVK